MRRKTQWILGTGLAVLAVLALALLVLTPTSTPPTKTNAWRIQPDQFPLGTVLQGSRVEMSLGIFSSLGSSPNPAFISGLPSPIRKACEWGLDIFRNLKAKSQWQLKVKAPDFLRVEKATIRSSNPLAFVSASLKTDQPGHYEGNLVVRLSSATFAPTNIVVRVTAIVAPARTLTRRQVLITATPYECYATEHGRDFEPLADLTTRLANKGIRVDLRQQLPSSLSGYSTVLLAAESLCGLNPQRIPALRKFVSDGGRLVLAADAFFSGTAPKADELLGSYGLEIIDKDAGRGITNSTVIADPFTSGVKRVGFWRPAAIKVTDPAQAKLLVVDEDVGGGFVAVSRSPNRGEVIVVTQSLWWNWIRSDPTNVDNCLLLENLLSR
jgi:hypothetical protein